jgi:hypothetical protein
MMKKDDLVEKLRKLKLYYFRCVQCALANHAHEVGIVFNEAADYVEATHELAEQYKWERDIAIGQLEELGLSFGQKVDGVYLTKEKYEELLEYKHMYEDLCK